MIMNKKCQLFAGFLLATLVSVQGKQASAADQYDLEEKVRILIRQNRQLQERLQEVENKLAEPHKSGEEILIVEKGDKNEFLSGLGNRLTFGGLVEFGGAWQETELESGDKEESSDLAMTTVELGIGMEVNPWLNLETVLLYEDPTFDSAESSLDVDVAALTLGNAEQFPFFLTAGKIYVPFGAVLTHMPDDPLLDSPLTLTMGDTGEKALLVGLNYQGISLSAYLFNGDVEEKDEDDQINDYGFDLNYSAHFPVSLTKRLKKGEKFPHEKTMEMDILVGASYIANLAESDGMTDAIIDADEDEVVLEEKIPGYAAYIHLGCHGLFLDGEYMAATESFEVSELVSNGKGARPEAWNLEAGFNYNWWKNLEVVFNYAGSKESGQLGFPERRFGLNFNQEIFEDTVYSLGYLKDFYEGDDSEGREERDLIFSQIAVEF